jgi:hypothetical protein
MLVTVAVLVIIMTILVQVFQSATGALSAAQTIQELDNQLKLLDATIRSDLGGVTARFTPPLDPALNLGYFEYGENEFADNQGEDSDDYIRFTAKAPPGRPFTGRMWTNAVNVPHPNFFNWNTQPVTVTSEYAEIIYFLRNGNLYRRVLLVAPELQSAGTSAIVPAIGNVPYASNGASLPNGNTFSSPALGATTPLSWQGVNDISARPAASGPNVNLSPTAAFQASQTIVLNTLGDLTNRENRFAYSRFANDFVNVANGNALGPDGIPDDVNGDNVPDYYPTLYPGVFNPLNPNVQGLAAWQLIYEPNYPVSRGHLGLMGFPFVFPGAYSRAQGLPNAGDKCGWIHAPAPFANVQQPDGTGLATYFDGNNPLSYLQSINHNPLDFGDNLPTPTNPENITNGDGVAMKQTWWGFPTWRETLSPLWTDPTVQVNVGPNLLASGGAAPQQPVGLVPLNPGPAPNGEVIQGFVSPGRALLPAMTALWRNPAQLFNDSAGDPTQNGSNIFFPLPNPLWSSLSWEDDLIMTGVRSFDVKAYDNALGGYGDLGWGDDLRLYIPYQNTLGYHNPGVQGLTGTPPLAVWPPLLATASSVGGTTYSTINQTFAHEGRMPPLVEDNRLDFQNPNPTYINYLTFTPQYSAYPNYSSNVGDDSPGVVRLRRVWDSWSTEYSRAPATGVNGSGSVSPGFPAGPPFSPPIYPSYPPPYPAPLRGIQIQIRVADPTNQRVKSITIRQDFTDKL